MSLETTTNEMLSYKQLSKDLRKIIKKELQEGSYEHLTNPDNKRGVKIPAYIEQLAQLKCRYSVATREQFAPGNGRNLNIGSNEIMLVLYETFKDDTDPAKGLQLQENYKARLILGKSFEDSIVESTILCKAGALFELARNGDFKSFIRESMTIVNDAIDIYKNCALADYN